MSIPFFDAAIIGAGAAGLFCAAQAGQRGLKVLLIDHADKVAEKIRISGGGRCNFTNRALDVRAPHKHFVGQNPQFCRSALSRYTPADFIALVQRHGIAFHEKHKGQLFADRSAEDIIAMLLAECADGRVERWQPCGVKSVVFLAAERLIANQAANPHPRPLPEGEGAKPAQPIALAPLGRGRGEGHPRPGNSQALSGFITDAESAGSYQINTDRGPVLARSLVIATGGLSIPKIGASDLGYRLAQQFKLPLVERRPGLVPLTFDGADWAPYAQLTGLALPVEISTGAKKERMAFHEDLLFTHRGLSGPAVLQISSYWQPGSPLSIDLAPGVDLPETLAQAKARSKKRIANELATLVPTRLAEAWASTDADWQRPINEAADKALARLAERLARWQLTPTGTEGYKKAEVTLGGVDTRALSQQSMECKSQPGLYFIGEVVDVTGWLGGYNFQWAWASGHACAQALPLG
ncbi:MAG TPA: NAD(P)/FAD-dependent oxidoreductase [Alicycliphilus sp.]|nr:NAD(P)/FAD-dependent oxidoreductase [Alicycliphilus sp.]